MAKVHKVTPGKKHYHPGKRYNDRIELLPGENTIPDKCLDDPYIKDLIAKGELVLPMQVTGVGTDLPEVSEEQPKKKRMYAGRPPKEEEAQ